MTITPMTSSRSEGESVMKYVQWFRNYFTQASPVDIRQDREDVTRDSILKDGPSNR